MKEDRKPFKGSPKKYHPRGLSILHEDRDLIVVDKVGGLLTMSDGRVREQTAFYLLNDYVRKGNPKSRKRIFIVHRLDRDTSGVVVFAKSEAARRYLQDEWPNFKKTYYAVVRGSLPKKEGELVSYLAENQAHRMYSVADPKKGKLAKTHYRVVRESPQGTLVEIGLLTGRKNQIRVQFAELGHPVVGDKKYGERQKGVKRLMLHAASLALTHPFSKEAMVFSAPVPAGFGVPPARSTTANPPGRAPGKQAAPSASGA